MPEKPSPATDAPTGTAVAKAPEPVGLDALPPEVRAAVEMRKAQNLVVAELGKMNWGAKVDAVTRRAVADWGNRYSVDVASEIDVLGNRIYLNSKFYYRRLSELVARGALVYAVADFVNPDERLDALAKAGDEWAANEVARRTRERILHAIPEDQPAACVFRIRLRSLSQEIVGVKWAGNGGKNDYGKANDPVGDKFPVETAESRACRRAMLKLTSHVGTEDPTLAQIIETQEAVGEIEPRVAGAIREFDEEEKRAPAKRIAPLAGSAPSTIVDGPGEPPSLSAYDDLPNDPDPADVVDSAPDWLDDEEDDG